MLKRILKISVYTLLIAIMLLAGSYYYLKSTWKDNLTKTELKTIIHDIKTAKKLPERFYELYEKEYPHSLTYGMKKQLFFSVWDKRNISIPVLQLSKIYSKGRKQTKTASYAIALKLEEETTQKECLNRLLEKFDFLNSQIGIEKASKFYFNKKVSELNDKEIAGIIVLMKNPVIYNPLKHKELFDKQVLEILNN